MVKGLRSRCRCGTALKKKELQNPLFKLLVGRGGSEESFCSKSCLDTACREQTVSKCMDLGIPFHPEQFQTPLRLGGT